MTAVMFRGFGFYRPGHTGSYTVYAPQTVDAGAWHGYGHVGLMPDLNAAKEYVKWLHDVGPDGVDAPAMFEDDIAGHVVAVNGSRPDEHAHSLDMIRDVADRLGQVELDLEPIFKDLVAFVHALEIASSQENAARAVGNFFITRGNIPRGHTLRLGNFGRPGEWNGDGLIASGLGEGWMKPLIERLLSEPIERFEYVCGVSAAERPSGYARSVFVEGPEPNIGPEAIEELRYLEMRLGRCLGGVWNPSVRIQETEWIASRLHAIAWDVAGMEPEGDQPAFTS